MIRPCFHWIVVDKVTRTAIFETRNRKLVDAINQEKYEAMDFEDYFDELAARIDADPRLRGIV